MDNTKEHTRLCRAIVKTIRERGGYAVRIHASPYQEHGTPDILACLAGRMFALEAKTGEGQLDKKQELEIAKLRKAGAIAGVVRSVAEAIVFVESVEQNQEN